MAVNDTKLNEKITNFSTTKTLLDDDDTVFILT